MFKISDFRSDTFTKPTAAMRAAMAAAEVGDDVFGEDPTINKLEKLAAEITGKEAALFVPTGTMGNSIAVKVWTKELEEVIVEERAHIYNMESTQMTFISRVTPRPIKSQRGAMDPMEIEKNIRQAGLYVPQTSLICTENTHNNWSGAVVPLANLQEIRKLADKYAIKVHMDGARIFNASVASGVSVKEYAATTDSMSFCFSKGLVAPVGSILVGPKDFIDYARRLRKALGGGMRQAGVLAAAAIIALTEMPARLKDDHRRAQQLAIALAVLPGIQLDPKNVETNIIIFSCNHPKISLSELHAKLKEQGILASMVSGGMRFVTHHNVDDEDVERAIAVFTKLLK